MSEAEKSVNVEDVLSSIRRLVANGSGPRIVPEHPKAPLVAKEDEPSLQSLEDVVSKSETEIKDDIEPASFVDTMNASIAEITENPDEEQPEDTLIPEVEERAAHVDAFIATETEQQPEADLQIEDVVQKAEPFVLRPEMVAEFEPIAPVNDTAPEPEAAHPEEETVNEDHDISFHDTLEDDGSFLENIEDEEAIEADPPIMDPALEAAMFDEEALRTIVGELVRAELQGDLGDRITRNVRKLVRREIHHALATRDFE